MRLLTPLRYINKQTSNVNVKKMSLLLTIKPIHMSLLLNCCTRSNFFFNILLLK